MGAFGACYAMRARLFVPVTERYIVDDFFLTFACFEQGMDAIVDLDAVCYESVSTEIAEEFRRKRRIAAGNFQNLNHFRDHLLPWKGGVATSFAFWSHKGLRWCGPFLLIGAFLSCLVLSVMEFSYLPLSIGLVGSLAAIPIDRFLVPRGWFPAIKPVRLVHYFYSMNLALFLGFLDFKKGSRNSIWEPTKRGDQKEEISDETRRESASKGEVLVTR